MLAAEPKEVVIIMARGRKRVIRAWTAQEERRLKKHSADGDLNRSSKIKLKAQAASARSGSGLRSRQAAHKIDRPLALLASPVCPIDFVGMTLIEFFDPICRFAARCFY